MCFCEVLHRKAVVCKNKKKIKKGIVGENFTFMGSQAYTSKRRILIQGLPPPNAYTKSANGQVQKNGPQV